jgi:hypothetical protein
MRFNLAGLPFVVTPSENLSPTERASIDRLVSAGPTAEHGGDPYVLHLVDQPPWHEPVTAGADANRTAELIPDGDCIRVRHRCFSALLENSRGRGYLYRSIDREYALEITLRIAMCCRLPAIGGIALHAAGIIVNGCSVVFFGPSGAGKTTIAGIAPYPVISDELVAVTPDSWSAQTTGFWSVQQPPPGTRYSTPLVALVELAKAPELELRRLEPMDAFRRLLGVTVLPPAAQLWQLATDALARLVAEVPVWRMHWSPSQPPWGRIEHILTR